jgi:hypothetical protein
MLPAHFSVRPRRAWLKSVGNVVGGGADIEGAPMPRKRDRSADCKLGRHRAAAPSPESGTDIFRATCRDCGQPLVRSLATRRWTFSGMLG